MADILGVAMALLAVCCVSRPLVLATDLPPRLYGVKKVAVTVSTDPDCDLNSQGLQRAVESRLRSAGIRIDKGARSHLNVVIGASIIRSGTGADLGFAYSVHLGLTQQVYLAHNPNRLTEAVTWQKLSLGTSPAAELPTRCERIISREMDEFITVYQAGAEK